jgi:hypothetical protein
LYLPPGAYTARLDLATGDIREMFSEFAPLSTWPLDTSNLSSDGRYFFVGTDTTLHRVDLEPDSTSYGSAPNVTAIAFSDSSLAHDGETEVTVTATITDAQGLGNIESVLALPIVDGVENRPSIEYPPLDPDQMQLYDDGTHGDATAGDGVYTYDGLHTDTYSEFYTLYSLPYDVGVRVIVKDYDDNYSIADTVLTVVNP